MLSAEGRAAIKILSKKGYDSILVVDGLMTDANKPYTVKLSRTFQDQNASFFTVSDATVFITDDTGNRIKLNNKGNGIYKTDSIEFSGIIGRTYTLHISTYEGDEYVSDSCSMQSVRDIDSIYFARDQELVSNNTESNQGIRIYLNSKTGDNNLYYRWDFEETWKYKIPNPKKYDYIDSLTIIMIPEVKEYCWKSRKSDEILIQSVYSQKADHIKKEPIFFIATEKSDRLMSEYSILISQYSISKNEYDFWNNLKQVNESGGDIFASQPFPVVSNIHNVNNPSEKVLGYFQVSAVKQKRKNISSGDIVGLNLPHFNSPCERIEKSVKDYPDHYTNWDDMYKMFCATSDYIFVEPIYKNNTNILDKLVFSRPECTKCDLTSSVLKPDFWDDIDW
jgi:hypothetical protein